MSSLKFVPINEITTPKPPNTSKMKRFHSKSKDSTSNYSSEDGWSIVQNSRSKKKKFSSTPIQSPANLQLDLSQESVIVPKSLVTSNKSKSYKEVITSNSKNTNSSISDEKKSNKLLIDSPNQSASIDTNMTEIDVKLVEKLSIEAQTSSILAVMDNIGSIDKNSIMSQDSPNNELEDKIVSSHNSTPVDGLFKDPRLMGDWSQSAGSATGSSSNNEVRLSIHIGDAKDLQLLSSILASKNAQINFQKAIDGGKLKLKLEIKHTDIYRNQTIPCGLCFIRVERQLELRALAEDNSIIPDDLDFHKDQDRQLFLKYLTNNSNPNTKGIVSKIKSHLYRKPYKSGFPEDDWQSEDFASSWCPTRNYKSLFIKVEQGSHAFLSYSSAFPDSKTYFTLNQIKETVTSCWNRYTFEKRHFFLLPIGNPDLDLEYINEAYSMLFRSLKEMYVTYTTISNKTIEKDKSIPIINPKLNPSKAIASKSKPNAVKPITSSKTTRPASTIPTSNS